VLVRGLEVRDGADALVVPDRACAACVHLGPVTLTVTDTDVLSIGDLPAGWSLRLRLEEPEVERELGLPSGSGRLRGKGVELDAGADGVVCVRSLGAGELAVACVGPKRSSAPHAEVLAEQARIATAWMEGCPLVDAEDLAMTRFCWWVLGVNTLRLGGVVRGDAVVPSKIGYVGLWQWDAYFIAIGLRHGAADLAAEQLRIALSRPEADGQLPDVLHEQGVLASSDDLPPGDLENLRAMASPALAGSRIPLTKPPLTALAVALVAEVVGRGLVDELRSTIERSHAWWFEGSDPGQTGVPAYLHPYSSGLDDSPIFDSDAILRSPDLTAYLALEARVLARWARERGEEVQAAEHEHQADELRRWLAASWDPERECFPAWGQHGPVAAEAIVGLMPLLVDGLDPALVEALVRSLEDPASYGTAFSVPTVPVRDPAFQEQRMWRGPVWVNTNWLIIRGLEMQGRTDLAERLRASTLAMVRMGGGPHEYFDCRTARKAPRATTCFGWSAALFVDLAVGRARGKRTRRQR
jgi:glycogen debranching enzyme